jgi:hypothetical protein
VEHELTKSESDPAHTAPPVPRIDGPGRRPIPITRAIAAACQTPGPPVSGEMSSRVMRSALSPASAASVAGFGGGVLIQRQLDDDGRFPARPVDGTTKRDILNELVAEALGVETEDEDEVKALDAYLRSSTATEASLVALLDDLIDLDEAYDGKDWELRAIESAHEAIIEAIYENDLGEDGIGTSKAWDVAVETGAWPLTEVDEPDSFEEAVGAAKRRREEAATEAARKKAAGLISAAEAACAEYREKDWLLPGTVSEIERLELAPERVAAALKQVLDAQRAATRTNWLAHLECTKANRIDGTENCHFTTFANGVMPGVETLDAGQSVDELKTELFNRVTSGKQIHATVVQGSTRYHRYWDGTYISSTGSRAAPPAPTKAQLDAEWTRMKTVLTARIEQARASFGRIGANRYGRQIDVKAILGL